LGETFPDTFGLEVFAPLVEVLQPHLVGDVAHNGFEIGVSRFGTEFLI